MSEPYGDEERRRLYDLLEEHLGEETARRLMAQMPPFRWEDIATKADLAALRAELKSDIGALQSDVTGVQSGVTGLQSGVTGLQSGVTELQGQMRHNDERLATFQRATDDRFEGLVQRLLGIHESMNGQFIQLNGAVNELRTEVVATTRGEVLDAVTSQGRFLLLAFVAALAALAGLAFTLAQLG